MTEPYRRRVPNRAEVLEILTRQGADLANFISPKRGGEKALWNALEAQGLAIPCGNRGKCATMIKARNAGVRDHKISLRKVPPEQRADYDRPWNQWYLCLSCNLTKTSKRGLQGLGSDASAIAKLRRIEKGKQHKSERRCRTIPSKPFPKLSQTHWPKTCEPPVKRFLSGQKLRGSGFQSGKRPWPSRPIPKRHRPDKDKPKPDEA